MLRTVLQCDGCPTLLADGCGRPISRDDGHPIRMSLEDEATARGWELVGARSYCRECRRIRRFSGLGVESTSTRGPGSV